MRNQKRDPADDMMDDAPSPEGGSYSQKEDLYNQKNMGQKVPYSDQGLQPSMLEEGGMVHNPQNQQRQQQPQQNQQQNQIQTPAIAAPPNQQVSYSSSEYDEIEELIESIVEEKWQSLMSNFGNIASWKDKVRTEISSIKQELMRLESRFENVQKAVLGKIQTYDKSIINVGSEIRALEKMLGKILEPLSDNIKELSRITKELKKSK